VLITFSSPYISFLKIFPYYSRIGPSDPLPKRGGNEIVFVDTHRQAADVCVPEKETEEHEENCYAEETQEHLPRLLVVTQVL
jgi:hypothetical protein